MNLLTHRKALGAYLQFAQFFLRPSGPRQLRHWKASEKIIRRYDNSVKQSDIRRTRLSNGFVFDRDVLGFEDQKQLVHVLRRRSRGEIQEFYVPLIDDAVARIIRPLIDLYIKDLKLYLGPSLRIDYYYFYSTTPASSGSVSSSWHTDNVGHRIKMFITLESDGKTPSAYIPGSNRKLYRMPVVEQFRFFGILDYRTKRGQKLIRHEPGSVALLDTNGLHRGVYEGSQSQRLCFIVEFINREKAAALFGRSLPVGPGRISPECDPTRFTDGAVAILSDMLDTRFLHDMGNGIQVYDLKRPSQEEYAQMGR